MLISMPHVVLNAISAFSGLVMMFTVAYFRFTLPNIANTISFTLSFWIGFIDFLWRIEYILEYSNEIMFPLANQHHWFVRLLAFARVFLRVWCSLIIMCIALDLQLSFIHNRNNMKKIQRWYTPISFLIAFCVNTPWLAESRVDYVQKWETIVPGWERRTSILTMFFGVTLWSALAILYSILVVLLILIRVRRETQRLRSEGVPENVRRRERRLIASVLRILLYPVVLIITQPTGIILDWLFIITSDSNLPALKILVEIDAVLLGLLGVLNLVVFTLNPAFRRAMETVPWWPFEKSSTEGYDGEDGYKGGDKLELDEPYPSPRRTPGETLLGRWDEAKQQSYLQTHVQHESYDRIT
ncbi:uncharacterized protein VTP21DRAFT_8823 [Calcarisporiella thermophila]|uniref:uncharacterized protein n=1 Tax=Calcarisporiella thermophila TaxID=911321 RepID=UPI003743ACEB